MRKALLIFSISLCMVSCGGESEKETNDEVVNTGTSQAKEESPEEAPSINGILESGDKFSTLAAASQVAQFERVLDQSDITLLAPQSEAFMALGEAKLVKLLNPKNGNELKKILNKHIVKGVFDTKKLKDGQVLQTLSGEKITVKKDGDKIMVGDALIVAPDIDVKNGVIHAIDKVL